MTSTPLHSPHPPRSLGALLAEQVRRRGSEPLVTYYDDASGERTELSYATFGNWASKTANLLAEELDAGRGTTIAVSLCDHWIGAVAVAAAWQLGAVVAFERPGADAGVVFAGEHDLDDVVDHPGLVAVGAGMGGRLTTAAPGLPYGDEVLAFGDDYVDPAVTLDDPALTAGDSTRSQADLLQQAWGSLGADDRLLATGPLRTSSVGTMLLAPIAAGGSLVWCPRSAGVDLEQRGQAERVTRVAGD